MASVSELKKLSRDLLNEFAVANGVADAADETVYKDKAALAEVLSPKVTPEQLAEFKASKEAAAADPANAPQGGENGAEQTPPAQDEENAEEQPTQPTDPATPPAGDGEGESEEEELDPATQPPKDAVSAETLAVGDRVSYPHREAEGGRLVGRVRGVSDDTAEVTAHDGSGRTFSIGQLRKV